MNSLNYLLKIIFIFFIINNIFISCNTESIPVDLWNENGLRKEAKKVTVYKNEITQYIKDGIINQDSILVFSKNTPKDLIPKVGDIIFIPITEKTPYGFFAKVNSIQTNSNIEIKTETALFNEVCEKQSIDTLFSISDKLTNCLDGTGNPLVYEYVSNQTNLGSKSQRAGGYGENQYKLSLKIPINENKENSKDKHFSVTGAVTITLDSIRFILDIQKFRLKRFDFSISPGLKLELSSKISAKSGWNDSTLIGVLNFSAISIETPVGIPIIIRPQLYLYIVHAVNGEVTVTSTFHYQYSSKFELNYQNNKWSYLPKNKDFSNKIPFSISEFEVNGENHIGFLVGFFCGFYSANSGFGISYLPKLQNDASFKFDMNNLMISNPEIKSKLSHQADLYFKASLFGRDIAQYSIFTPEYIFWSEKLFLLPQISNFTAVGDGVSSATINYQIDSNSLLGFLGTVNQGFVVYDSFGNIIKTIYSPTNVKPDNLGISSCSIQVPNLDATKDYYAAPLVSFISNTSSNYCWYGNKVEFNVYPAQIKLVSYNITSTSYLLNGYTGADGKLYSYRWEFNLNANIRNSKNVLEWGICYLKKYNWSRDSYVPITLKEGDAISNHSLVSNYYPCQTTYAAYAKLLNGDIIYSNPLVVTFTYNKSSAINKWNTISKTNCISVPD
ncbi:MAG: hypothetical protein ACOYOT_11045 [Bacteroidales bacterium]